MNRAEILSKVKALVAKQAKVSEAEVKESSSFEDLALDSLDLVELIVALEEEFGAEIPEEEAEKITTVGEAVEYIERAKRK